MKVLVVGDSMVDVYYLGHITRLNPEDPAVPLVHLAKSYEFPGGAANVAENFKAMKDSVNLVSGAGLLQKFRVVSNGRVILRFDSGQRLLPIQPQMLEDAGMYDAIVASDYGKGSIGSSAITHIVSAASPYLFVDTKSDPSPWTRYATCLFPNEAEYVKYKQQYDQARRVLIKRGRHGSLLMRDGKCSQWFTSRATKVVNVSGAGDTVMASYAHMYCSLQDKTNEQRENTSAQFSMHMAAISISEMFTHAPTMEELKSKFPDYYAIAQ